MALPPQFHWTSVLPFEMEVEAVLSPVSIHALRACGGSGLRRLFSFNYESNLQKHEPTNLKVLILLQAGRTNLKTTKLFLIPVYNS